MSQSVRQCHAGGSGNLSDELVGLGLVRVADQEGRVLGDKEVERLVGKGGQQPDHTPVAEEDDIGRDVGLCLTSKDLA